MLKYDARKGSRIKSQGFIWICVWAHNNKLWWDGKKWSEYNKPPMSSMVICRSVRAFRRRLREWSKYLPSGTEFCLVSRYKNHCVYGKTK